MIVVILVRVFNEFSLFKTNNLKKNVLNIELMSFIYIYIDIDQQIERMTHVDKRRYGGSYLNKITLRWEFTYVQRVQRWLALYICTYIEMQRVQEKKTRERESRRRVKKKKAHHLFKPDDCSLIRIHVFKMMQSRSREGKQKEKKRYSQDWNRRLKKKKKTGE